MRLEHHLVGGYVRYISPHIIIIITCTCTYNYETKCSVKTCSVPACDIRGNKKKTFWVFALHTIYIQEVAIFIWHLGITAVGFSFQSGWTKVIKTFIEM